MPRLISERYSVRVPFDRRFWPSSSHGHRVTHQITTNQITTNSDHHEDVVAAPHHLVFAQLEPAVGGALAGLDVVLVAVPRADEMQLVGEGLALVGAVGPDDVDHLVDQDSLAGGSAGVQAVVAVGVIVAVLEEHADLVLAGNDNATVAVLELGGLGDKALGHCGRSPSVCLAPRQGAAAGRIAQMGRPVLVEIRGPRTGWTHGNALRT